MDVRIRIAATAAGENVAALCRELAISRQTFYLWRRRFRAEGLEGLEPRRRTPRSKPRQTAPEVEEEIVALRKELADDGLDAGAATIRWHLLRRGRPAPSEATIWRVLGRRGQVVPEPRKRPTASYRRFAASAPNELWQADCCDWDVAGQVVKILSFLDDHSRRALRVKALPLATTDATWETFCEATAAYGVPLGQLTDNGLNFSGRLRGFEVRFEIELRAIGVVPKTSRPYHPQTCGKVERFQQTLKRWLARRPAAVDLADLQAQLDAFVAYYNHERPHRGVGRRTPAEAWAATPPAINLGIALPSPTTVRHELVDERGVLCLGRYRIHVGVQWRRMTARVHFDDTAAAVFIDNRLVRVLVLDPSRSYQPSGLPRGRRACS